MLSNVDVVVGVVDVVVAVVGVLVVLLMLVFLSVLVLFVVLAVVSASGRASLGDGVRKRSCRCLGFYCSWYRAVCVCPDQRACHR